MNVPVFPGGNLGCHVDHGWFWPEPGAGLGLGWFHADFIVRYGSEGYVVSDGYGGAHALLFGFAGGALTGNVYTGQNPISVSFGGHYQAAPGEWLHGAVDWDGQKIRVYVNGI